MSSIVSESGAGSFSTVPLPGNSRHEPITTREYSKVLLESAIAAHPSDTFRADEKTLSAAGPRRPYVHLHCATTDQVISGRLKLVHTHSLDPESGKMVSHGNEKQILLIAPEGRAVMQQSIDGQFRQALGDAAVVPLASIDYFAFEREPFTLGSDKLTSRQIESLESLAYNGPLLRLEMMEVPGSYLEASLTGVGVSREGEVSLWLHRAMLKTAEGSLAELADGGCYIDTAPRSPAQRYDAALFRRGCVVLPHELKLQSGVRFSFDTGVHERIEPERQQDVVLPELPDGRNGVYR